MTQDVLQPNESADPHATHRNHHPLNYRQVVGDMYSQWALDCVIEVAYAVSKDFIARPESLRYTRNPALVPVKHPISNRPRNRVRSIWPLDTKERLAGVRSHYFH
jgi:hypothetical protein